ncbi:hypothetical protein [Fibrobacter succinogenes]|uniref:hypothetical protein n=1 Tax=Fibrobacter succinogenes TaxID=833 RepID=UPI0013D652D4|nr:hypothetical protein [Fibrobacter succinogenes]
MERLNKWWALLVLAVLVGCSLKQEDYSDYCPIAVKLIPLEMEISYKCAPNKKCNQYPARLEIGRVSRYLDIDCWGGIYKYTFVSGDIQEEATNDYRHPYYELQPDSSNTIHFALIDAYGDQKKYDIKLTDYIPKYSVTGDTLEIDATEGIKYYYKSHSEWGFDPSLKLEISDDIMPFFEFFHAERMANDDSLMFSGTVYWR